MTPFRRVALHALKVGEHFLQLCSLIAMAFFVGASASLYFVPVMAQPITERVEQVTNAQAVDGAHIADLIRRVQLAEEGLVKLGDRQTLAEGSLNRIFGFGAAFGALVMILQLFQILNVIKKNT